MSKTKEYYHDIIAHPKTLDGYMDQEYQEFRTKVLSGEITEKSLLGTPWLDMYKIIKSGNNGNK